MEKASKDADAILDEIGKSWGNKLADSTSAELGRHGRDFGTAIEHATEKVTVKVKSDFTVDRNGRLHDAAGRFVAEFKEDTERAFRDLARPGGPFSRIGEGLADAIGAGFNVSGRSPLIAVLIPLFGTIAALVAAALQAANALLAVLTTLPALLAAVSLQVGTLMLAFDGVGAAIQGAFAAKNWNEFYAAIQGLTPAAQNFIITLLPLRDLFRELKSSAQQSFFTGFGNTMVNLVQQLGPVLRAGIPQLALALGELFKSIGLFFASPVFVDFVSDIIPATLRWLGQFGPGFVSTLTAIIRMADMAIPFLERVGQVVTGAFGIFTSWLNEQINSGNLTEWLNRMAVTLDSLVNLFFMASEFVVSFLDALDKAGGDAVIDQFSELFEQLAMFFQSEAGQAAMAGFIHLVEALTFSFSGLIFTLMGLLIAFESILQFFQFIGAAFTAFIDWMITVAEPAIAKFFLEDIPGYGQQLGEKLRDIFKVIGFYIGEAWNSIIGWVQTRWNDFTGWLLGKVAEVGAFFAGLPDRLADIGRNIMHGLWEGIMWGWDHTVKPVLEWITSQLPSWKGPEERDRKLLEPAGQAVMEGFGKGLSRGADDLRNMLGDFTNSIGNVGYKGSEVGSMPINVSVAFHGATPTEQQAYETGVAAGKGVGDGFAEQVEQRNVRFAVRVA